MIQSALPDEPFCKNWKLYDDDDDDDGDNNNNNNKENVYGAYAVIIVKSLRVHPVHLMCQTAVDLSTSQPACTARESSCR